VHRRREVGEHRGRGVGERVELEHPAALLGDEHAAVGGEAHGCRRRETAEGGGLLEAGRDDGGRAGGQRDEEQKREQQRPDDWHPPTLLRAQRSQPA